MTIHYAHGYSQNITILTLSLSEASDQKFKRSLIGYVLKMYQYEWVHTSVNSFCKGPYTTLGISIRESKAIVVYNCGDYDVIVKPIEIRTFEDIKLFTDKLPLIKKLREI